MDNGRRKRIRANAERASIAMASATALASDAIREFAFQLEKLSRTEHIKQIEESAGELTGRARGDRSG